MKKSFLTLVLVAIVIAAKGEPFIEISSKIVDTVSADSYIEYIEINSNVDWDAESNSDWIDLIKISSNLLQIDYCENKSLLEKEYLITISGEGISKSIIRVQRGATPFIRTDRTEYSVGPFKGEKIVEIESNIPSWTYNPLQACSWAKVWKLGSVEHEGDALLIYKENDTGEERTWTAKLYADGADTLFITLTQRAKDPPNLEFVYEECSALINGNEIKLKTKITNTGQVKSSFTYVAFYISPIPSNQNKDIFGINSEILSALESEDTIEVNYDFKLDEIGWEPKYKEYYFVSVIDPDFELIGENRTGNVFVFDEKLFIEDEPEVCEDPLEPNNSSSNAHSLGSFIGYQNYLCLESEDEDWIKFVHNGEHYYFVIKADVEEKPVSYSLNFLIDPRDILELNILLGYDGNFENPEIILYDSNKNFLKQVSGTGHEVSLFYLLESSTSIYTKEESPFEVYPNPVENILKINSNLKYEKIHITNSSGLIVFEKNDFSNELDLSEISSGIYFLKIYFNDKVIVNKIIKL